MFDELTINDLIIEDQISYEILWIDQETHYWAWRAQQDRTNENNHNSIKDTNDIPF